MGGGIMMAISVNTAQNLYWMGRYLQRAETLLKELLIGYDNVVDRDFEYGSRHYQKLDIEIDYKNANDFLRQGVYGNHPSSIASMILMARENGIETRNLLNERGFARLNQMHTRLLSECGKTVIPSMLEDFIDDIAFILGIYSSELERPASYALIRLGQYVERYDLILRLYDGFELVVSEIDALHTIAKQLNPHYDSAFFGQKCSNANELLVCINTIAHRVIHEKVCPIESLETQEEKE